MTRPANTKPCRNCGAPMDERLPTDFCALCVDEDEAREERGDDPEEGDPVGG